MPQSGSMSPAVGSLEVLIALIDSGKADLRLEEAAVRFERAASPDFFSAARNYLVPMVERPYDHKVRD